MTKKLFTVEVTYKAYAWAEDKFDAEGLVSEIVDTESYSDIEIEEVDFNVLDWDLESCVYHNEKRDIQLREVLVSPRLATKVGTSNLVQVRSSVGDGQPVAEDDVDFYLEQ
jgi:hypothetical protein